MVYQIDSLKQVKRKAGIMWQLRYRTTSAHGKRVEHDLPVDLVSKFPREQGAWREVDQLRLLVRINSEENGTRDTFAALAESYIEAEFGDDAVRPKSVNTDHYALREGLPHCPLGG